MPAMWRSVKQTIAASAVTFAALTITVPAATADDGNSGPPVYFMTWDATGDATGALTYDPSDWAEPGLPTEYGTWNLGSDDPYAGGGRPREATGWRYRGGFSGVNNAWTLSWDCVVNPDPFVDATINVTNNSATTQTFFISMPLDIEPVGPQTEMFGSVSAVVSDQNSGGATLASTADQPVYQAYIDPPSPMDPGSVVRTMFDNPNYSLTAPQFGNANDDDSFANEIFGGPVNNRIAIQLRFTLTPGDSASVTGIFRVEPIPGPAGLPILAGLLAFGRRRRS